MAYLTKRISFLLAVAVLLAPSLAHAHARLVRSEPASGARSSTSPVRIRLWFSERPEVAMTFAGLKDSGGNSIPLGKPARIEGDKLGIEFSVQRWLAPGRYKLSWQTAAADGHPLHGELSFEVLPSATATSPPVASRADLPVSESPAAKASTPINDDDHAASIPNSAARALLFIGLLVLIGSVTFALVVLPSAVDVNAESKASMLALAARTGIGAAILIAATALLRLNLESMMMKAMPDMPGMAGITTQDMVINTTWGVAFMLQLASAIIALLAFVMAVRRIVWAWYLAAACAVVLAITPALSGHAAATLNLTGLVIFSDWLHVLAGGAWLGTLFCVMTIGIPVACKCEGDERWTCVSSLVRMFSKVAMLSVATIVISGAFASWIHLTALSDLWNTTYGKTLLAKIVLALVALSAGAYNFKRVQPQLQHEHGTSALRRSATAELATGVLILIVTGFLTGLSP